jgi:small-conductance mechanosensitive channel
LAVALALQDTLANFFAGVQLVSDKPIKVGEYIGLESGEQGFVTKVGWRSTQIRMIQNNMVIMPNSQLINSRITNYHLPVPEMSLRIPVGVDYRSDLEHVERVTIEVAREVQQTVDGVKPDFEPFIRYKDFGDFSIGFVVVLRITDFVAQYRITHEFVKRLHRRYNQEGITIPFPIRTLEISRGASGKKPRPAVEPEWQGEDGGSLSDAPTRPEGGEEQELL